MPIPPHPDPSSPESSASPNKSPSFSWATADWTSANPPRVLITGASRGLGFALAKRLRKQGATVVGIARNHDQLEAALTSIDALPLAGDVSDDATALITRAMSLAGGPFDLVVHAASTLGPLGGGDDPMPRLATLSDEQLQRVFEVNTLGPARLFRALHRSMRKAGGTLVAISSDAAESAYPGWGAYGASKRAFDHLLRVWAEEEAELRFFAFDPGEMDTQMHAAALPTADRATLAAPDEVAGRLLAKLASDVPSGARMEVMP